MGYCKYCNKEIKNIGGLRKHEKDCKLNPNRTLYKSNLVKYNDDVKHGVRTGSNQFIKAKQNNTKCVVSDVTKDKISKSMTGKRWSVHRKQKHSDTMKQVVIDNPNSYSASNVCGRTKLIEYNGFKLNGKWELLVAKWLSEQSLNWTNIFSSGFEYEWNGKTHLYFPDFYIKEIDTYIEVKGYERPRDRCKWKSFPHKLIVLKLNEINKIKNNTMGPITQMVE